MAQMKILITTAILCLHYLRGCSGIMEQKLVLESNHSLVCLEVYTDPESPATIPEVAAQLIVASNGGSYQQFTGGEGNINSKDLIPGRHKLTLMHTLINKKHSLSIYLDDKPVPFKMESQPRWMTAFDFQSVIIMADGPVTVSKDMDCIISASGGYSLASPVGIACLAILLLLLTVALGVFIKCCGNKGNSNSVTQNMTKHKEMTVYTKIDGKQEPQCV